MYGNVACFKVGSLDIGVSDHGTNLRDHVHDGTLDGFHVHFLARDVSAFHRARDDMTGKAAYQLDLIFRLKKGFSGPVGSFKNAA